MTLRINYRLAQSNLHAGATLALIGLTGLSLQDSKQATLHRDRQIVTVNDAIYPLSRQALDLLRNVSSLQEIDFKRGLRLLKSNAEDLRQALYAALWATSDEGQFLHDVTALPALSDLPTQLSQALAITQPHHLTHQRTVLQNAVDYMLESAIHEIPLWRKLWDAKLVFLIVSTGVNGLNVLYSIVMGRLLSPADFGQVTFANMLLLIFGLIPIAMQTVSSRFGAIYVSQKNDALLQQLWRYGTRSGWLMGVLFASLLVAFAPTIVQVFQLRDVWIVYVLAAAIPFFLATGTDRGILQGQEDYDWLSWAYFVEGVVRLGVGVLLAMLFSIFNRSVDGAVLGLTGALIATWFISWWAMMRRAPQSPSAVDSKLSQAEQQEWRALFIFIGMSLLGQALITNSDFMLVKSLFAEYEAGLYAAIAVTGRVVYFGTLPLTILIVPLIAREQSLGKSTRPLLMALMGSGIVLCGAAIAVTFAYAPQIIETLYGVTYVSAAYLLPLLTIASSLFVLANLLVTYQVALGTGSATWMPLLASVVQIGGILMFHDSLTTVITVQIVVMSVLLMGVLWRSIK